MRRERVAAVTNAGSPSWCDFFVLTKRIAASWNEIGRSAGDANLKPKRTIQSPLTESAPALIWGTKLIVASKHEENGSLLDLSLQCN